MVVCVYIFFALLNFVLHLKIQSACVHWCNWGRMCAILIVSSNFTRYLWTSSVSATTKLQWLCRHRSSYNFDMHFQANRWNYIVILICFLGVLVGWLIVYQIDYFFSEMISKAYEFLCCLLFFPVSSYHRILLLLLLLQAIAFYPLAICIRRYFLSIRLGYDFRQAIKVIGCWIKIHFISFALVRLYLSKFFVRFAWQVALAKKFVPKNSNDWLVVHFFLVLCLVLLVIRRWLFGFDVERVRVLCPIYIYIPFIIRCI